MSEQPKFTVTKQAKRPALPDATTCFYCQQPIGGTHADSCVLVVRKIRVRMSVEYEVEVPAFWDKERFEYHRNEGSWCSNNAMEELQGLVDRDGCLCHATRFEYLGDAGEPRLREAP